MVRTEDLTQKRQATISTSFWASKRLIIDREISSIQSCVEDIEFACSEFSIATRYALDDRITKIANSNRRWGLNLIRTNDNIDRENTLSWFFCTKAACFAEKLDGNSVISGARTSGNIYGICDGLGPKNHGYWKDFAFTRLTTIVMFRSLLYCFTCIRCCWGSNFFLLRQDLPKNMKLAYQYPTKPV